MRGDSTDPAKTEPIASSVSRSLSSGDGGASLKPPRAEAGPSARGAELSASAPPASTTGAFRAAPTQDNGTADAAEAGSERIAALHQQMWSDAASLSEGEGIGSDQNGAPNPAAEKPDEPARSEEVSAAASSSAPSDAPSIAPPIDLVAAIERAAREVGEPNLVPHPTVLLENLSQQQKDRIPTIVYSEHVYAEGRAVGRAQRPAFETRSTGGCDHGGRYLGRQRDFAGERGVVQAAGAEYLGESVKPRLW